MNSSALAWQDHAVIIAYLASMLLLGAYLSRRRQSDVEYFLGGRTMPWFAVGISVIASLLSSLTYLSEPGEVWKSGVTHVFGKMLAIPLEVVIVWCFCIPFMMRFRYTSAYEYLEERFGLTARYLGVAMFLLMVVLWMGFVVLVSSQALVAVSGMPLLAVIGTVGIVATLYTMMGGLRAVIWTDVVQVLLLIGGGLFTIGFIAWDTGTWLPDWYAAAQRQLSASQISSGAGETYRLPWFSFDPTIRATVVTVAASMCVWHVCTHTANQMTVQRYFSTTDAKTARRSFLTATLFGVGINLMLVAVGLAVLYYYFGQGIPLDGGLNSREERDLIFPTFAIHRLPPGLGGGILAALLAAAMSSIDSGVNSIATVLSVEMRRVDTRSRPQQHGAESSARPDKESHVKSARLITIAAGTFITLAAFGLSYLPDKWGIVGAMPRTFNAVTAPLGGLFLVGMLLPMVRQGAVVGGVVCGLATSVGLGYWEPIALQLQNLGLNVPAESISFALIMPAALAITFLVSWLGSLVDPSPARDLAGLTWYTRRDKPGLE